MVVAISRGRQALEHARRHHRFAAPDVAARLPVALRRNRRYPENRDAVARHLLVRAALARPVRRAAMMLGAGFGFWPSLAVAISADLRGLSGDDQDPGAVRNSPLTAPALRFPIPGRGSVTAAVNRANRRPNAAHQRSHIPHRGQDDPRQCHRRHPAGPQGRPRRTQRRRQDDAAAAVEGRNRARRRIGLDAAERPHRPRRAGSARRRQQPHRLGTRRRHRAREPARTKPRPRPTRTASAKSSCA